ncbi:Rho GTPase-activating protein 4 [Ranunculus cassubicifolius]
MAEVILHSSSHFSSPTRKLYPRERRDHHKSPLSLVSIVFRKYLMVCSCDHAEKGYACSMEIGSPTNVIHEAHVTFDKFQGLHGVPVEFESEIPRSVPSASRTIFGVSMEAMKYSYDTRGNTVPTILLQMQKRLYAQGGLEAEGIFRICGKNSQEEYLRDQLNNGIVPDSVDVHCLACLIKAWFRELPKGILDCLLPEQVMQAEEEEECDQLVKMIPPIEGALLNWVVNLMADIVQEEARNKMNAHNLAVVFAPNMAHFEDSPIALTHVVHVMKLLKKLITRTLKEREALHSEDPVMETSY